MAYCLPCWVSSALVILQGWTFNVAQGFLCCIRNSITTWTWGPLRNDCASANVGVCDPVTGGQGLSCSLGMTSGAIQLILDSISYKSSSTISAMILSQISCLILDTTSNRISGTILGSWDTFFFLSLKLPINIKGMIPRSGLHQRLQVMIVLSSAAAGSVPSLGKPQVWTEPTLPAWWLAN